MDGGTRRSEGGATQRPGTARPGSTAGRWRRRARREAGRSLELAAVTGFAVAAPVLGPFGEAPDVFVAMGASRGQVVAFGVLVALAPVVVVAGLAALTRLAGATARSWTQTVLVAGLAALYAVDVARGAGADPWLRVAVALVAVAGVATAHRRWAPARQWLRYAAPAPLLFLAVFLAFSSTSSLVFPADASVEAAADGHEAPPVVVIVLDELPTLSLVDGAGGIDRHLFPNLARLTETATWYRDATSVAPATSVAVPAILTGTVPEQAQTFGAVYDDHPDNLFTLLAPTHELNVMEWVTELCPPSLCPERDREVGEDAARLFEGAGGDRRQPMDLLVEEAVELWWSRIWPTAEVASAEQMVLGAEEGSELAEQGLAFLSSLGPTDGPTLDFLHLPVPHMPWKLLPSGHHYDGPETPRGAEFLGWGTGPHAAYEAELGRARHLLQAQWADRLLGAIFDRLVELDRWDESLVVVTADHGISFTEDRLLRMLRPENQVELQWVPLFVKLPGQRSGAVDDGNVRSIDVLPTIADVVGIDVPWDPDGTSFAPGTGERPTGKPSVSDEPATFGVEEGQQVELEADGLDRIRSAPAAGGGDDPADPLRVWRVGRHGHLVGRPTAELGTCGAGPAIEIAGPLPGDDDLDQGQVPAWIRGRVEGPDQRQVVLAVDGTIVGWDETSGGTDRSEMGMLAAQPLLGGPGADVGMFELVEGDGCRLHPMAIHR